jgi:hypothetical protein
VCRDHCKETLLCDQADRSQVTSDYPQLASRTTAHLHACATVTKTSNIGAQQRAWKDKILCYTWKDNIPYNVCMCTHAHAVPAYLCKLARGVQRVLGALQRCSQLVATWQVHRLISHHAAVA